jgi:hypothetical protein
VFVNLIFNGDAGIIWDSWAAHYVDHCIAQGISPRSYFVRAHTYVQVFFDRITDFVLNDVGI